MDCVSLKWLAALVGSRSASAGSEDIDRLLQLSDLLPLMSLAWEILLSLNEGELWVLIELWK